MQTEGDTTTAMMLPVEDVTVHVDGDANESDAVGSAVFAAHLSPPLDVHGAEISPGSGRKHLRALLFRAGEYPDKGITVTTEDLDAIVARFHQGEATVPVRLEHTDTAADPLGAIVALYRVGSELFGVASFGQGILSHLDETGGRHMSITLRREGSSFRLTEASVVLSPRVSGAGLLLGEERGRHPRRTVRDRIRPFAEKIAQFRGEGRITPAMEAPLARLQTLAGVAATDDTTDADDPFEFRDAAPFGPMLDAVQELLRALPPTLPQTATVPVAFSTPGETPPLPLHVARYAEAFGIAPSRILGE